MTEPESVRWVRYAADCAERVLPLTGTTCRWARAAIAAARAWADCPCVRHRQAARDAAKAVYDIETIPDSARAAARAALTANAVWTTAGYACWAADCAARSVTDSAWNAEFVWQAERRRHYELP